MNLRLKALRGGRGVTYTNLLLQWHTVCHVDKWLKGRWRQSNQQEVPATTQIRDDGVLVRPRAATEVVRSSRITDRRDVGWKQISRTNQDVWPESQGEQRSHLLRRDGNGTGLGTRGMSRTLSSALYTLTHSIHTTKLRETLSSSHFVGEETVLLQKLRHLTHFS